jgi:PAS domain S-box-containing protein
VSADREALRASMQTVFQEGRAQVEVRLATKDGMPIPFFCSGVRLDVDDGSLMLGIGIDIRAQKYAEIARRSTERLLATVVECTQDAIFSRALDGRILSWNEGARRLYGYTHDEIVDQLVTAFVPPERLDELRETLETIGRGQTVAPFETQRYRKDGTLVDIWLSVSPLKDSAGTVTGVCGIARDITERKKAEEQLRRLRAELDSQRMKTFRATMTTVQDIVNNFLMNLQVIRLEAGGQLSEELLVMLDGVIEGTAAELKALGDLQNVCEKTLAIGTGIDYRRPNRHEKPSRTRAGCDESVPR